MSLKTEDTLLSLDTYSHILVVLKTFYYRQLSELTANSSLLK